MTAKKSIHRRPSAKVNRTVKKPVRCSARSVRTAARRSLALYHQAFTLIELMIAIGIIGILSFVVIVAINPAKQLCDAENVKRKLTVREFAGAMMQYMISTGDFPAKNIPTGEANAKQICRQGIIGDDTCINFDSLVPDYLVALPIDQKETDSRYTGYTAYFDGGQRPTVLPLSLIHI